MSFGYFPDFKNKSKAKDLLLKIIGYPYAPRRNEARLVIKCLNLKKTDKILDVGCGDGIFTNFLISKGFDVAGVDISETAIQKAKERAEKMRLKVNYLACDAGKMPFETNSFDKIMSISTFEHMENDDASFKECHRVLKPGGLFVLSVPTPKVLLIIKTLLKLPKSIKKLFLNTLLVNASNKEEYRKLLDDKFFHYRNYTNKLLKEKANLSGFEIEKVDGHIKFFSVIPHSIIHSFKFFEWEKDNKDKYSFANELAIVATFPLFYLFYLLDDLVLLKRGSTLVLVFRKPKF